MGGLRPVRLAGILVVTCAGAVSAQISAASRSLGALRLATDTEVTIGRLPNGLRYYVRANQRPENRAALRLVVAAGSAQEDADQRGVAHLLEHMAFRGTSHFPNRALVDHLESLGMRFGVDVNATTSYEHTTYRLAVPTDTPGALETGLQVLEDWARGMRLDSTELTHERDVVLAEWRSRQGADARIRVRHDSVLLAGSRFLERDPIGDPDDLIAIGRDPLVRFYDDWYRPDLMAVIVVGDVDGSAVESMIRERFGSLPPPEAPRPRLRFTIPDNPAPRISVAVDSAQPSWRVEVLRKYQPRPADSIEYVRDEVIERLIDQLYASILDRRLEEVALRADAPFLRAKTGFRELPGGVRAASLEVIASDGRLDAALAAALTEVERLAQHGPTATELEREKRVVLRCLEGERAARDVIASSQHAAAYVRHFLTGKPPTSIEDDVAHARALLPAIGSDDVAAVARRWRTRENTIVLASAPDRPGAPLPSANALRAVLDSVAARPLVGFTHDASGVGTLEIDTRLEPGSVVRERRVPGTDVLDWTLSNGARVLVKPTDFHPDEVLLGAFGWGGTSLVEDDDLPNAVLASRLPEISGVGRWSATALERALAGKLAWAAPELDRYTQGVTGSASARDVETLFQLVHLLFTAPSVDTAAIRAYRQRARASLDGRQSSPDAHFADTVAATLWSGHLRARTLTPADVDAMDAERALAIYRERFADASGFTFVLVGTLDPDSVRLLVGRYLGGLPSLHREDGWRDHGLRFPSGVIEKSFRFGGGPRSRTAIVYDGPYRDGADSQVALNALAHVLELRLRRRLREQLGATYAVAVQAEIHAIPERAYTLTIEFDSAPDRADELVEAVFAEVDRLRRYGPPLDALEKVRAAAARSLEIERKNNRYWIARLVSFARADRPLEDLADHDLTVRGLEAGRIRAMAQRYLDPNRYIRVTQMPD